MYYICTPLCNTVSIQQYYMVMVLNSVVYETIYLVYNLQCCSEVYFSLQSYTITTILYYNVLYNVQVYFKWYYSLLLHQNTQQYFTRPLTVCLYNKILQCLLYRQYCTVLYCIVHQCLLVLITSCDAVVRIQSTHLRCKVFSHKLI